MSKREREPCISGDEMDWTSGIRHVLKVFDNWTGLGKQVKQKMNKRARRRTKRELSGNPRELESERSGIATQEAVTSPAGRRTGGLTMCFPDDEPVPQRRVSPCGHDERFTDWEDHSKPIRCTLCELKYLRDLNDALYASQTAANQECEIAEDKLATSEARIKQLENRGILNMDDVVNQFYEEGK